uniref:Uncharacterized protein n=1 Tax=Timema genevievae TaxID=629358 RepID=A0A7R9K8J7_TIMGE|nr:unnamed protein product [Timema genevievae]
MRQVTLECGWGQVNDMLRVVVTSNFSTTWDLTLTELEKRGITKEDVTLQEMSPSLMQPPENDEEKALYYQDRKWSRVELDEGDFPALVVNLTKIPQMDTGDACLSRGKEAVQAPTSAAPIQTLGALLPSGVFQQAVGVAARQPGSTNNLQGGGVRTIINITAGN